MIKSKVLILFLLIIIQITAFGQVNDTVRYTTDFKFADGFYLSFSMVKNNSPIPIARIVTKFDRSDSDFYNKLLQEKAFVFFDGNGVKQKIPTSKLWGFSRNGVLYIRKSEGFHRVTIIGSICHFVATITSYNTQYYDPYYSPYNYNSRYYNPYYSSSPRETKKQEVKQYLIDFETGKVLEYDVNSVEILLMKDSELYDEYMALKKKKKKQLKFYYIRKFNEDNPIYFPVNKRF